MSIHYPAIIYSDLYADGVMWTRPETDPVAPQDKAEPNEPLERDRIAIGTADYPHFCVDAPPPILKTYRDMREHPMIVFAYFLVTAPILAGTRTLEIRTPAGEDAPPRKIMPGLPGVQVRDGPEDKFKRITERLFEDQWPDILTGLECLNYGHWTQEVTWDRRENVIAPVRFNSFRPWEIVLIPDVYNDFAGFKLGGEEVDARYVFHAICDEHRQPLIGHPRARDALTAWWRTVRSHENADRLERKASGIQMMLGIAKGMTFKDASGNTVSHGDATQTIFNAAVSGKTWTYSMFAFDLETLKAHPDLAKVPGMKVDTFDWGQTGPSLLANIARLGRLDKEILRAYHRPEREATEGEHGTKAEAGVHGQVGITDSELVHTDFLTQFNEQTFNRYLVTNRGPDAAGSMYWKPSPLADPQQKFLQEVAKLLYANPAEGPTMVAHTDRRALLERLEMPLLDPSEVQEPPPPPEAQPAEMAGGRIGQMEGANGNGDGN
jgi:hypothetical protein